MVSETVFGETSSQNTYLEPKLQIDFENVNKIMTRPQNIYFEI